MRSKTKTKFGIGISSENVLISNKLTDPNKEQVLEKELFETKEKLKYLLIRSSENNNLTNDQKFDLNYLRMKIIYLKKSLEEIKNPTNKVKEKTIKDKIREVKIRLNCLRKMSEDFKDDEHISFKIVSLKGYLKKLKQQV